MNATTKSIDAVKLLWDGRSIIICDTPGFVVASAFCGVCVPEVAGWWPQRLARSGAA
jgi:hypothetical protein